MTSWSTSPNAESRCQSPVASLPIRNLVAMLAQAALRAAIAELRVDRIYVVRLPGQKLPSRGACLERIGIGLEHVRRIVLGIDGDRNEEDITPDGVTEPVLHLCQPRRFNGTKFGAARVDKVHHHDPAFDQVVVEAQRLSVLGNHRHVGEVAGAPAVDLGLRHARHREDHRHQTGNPGKYVSHRPSLRDVRPKGVRPRHPSAQCAMSATLCFRQMLPAEPPAW